MIQPVVYILRCKNGRFYIGSTNDIQRRLEEHQSGHTASLRALLPVELAFKQKYDTMKSARKIEYRLKKLKSRTIIERIVQEQKIAMQP